MKALKLVSLWLVLSAANSCSGGNDSETQYTQNPDEGSGNQDPDTSASAAPKATKFEESRFGVDKFN